MTTEYISELEAQNKEAESRIKKSLEEIEVLKKIVKSETKKMALNNQTIQSFKQANS